MSAAEELKNLVSLIKLSPPDLIVVSLEGMKFPTWRLLLALHSPMLSNLLIQVIVIVIVIVIVSACQLDRVPA